MSYSHIFNHAALLRSAFIIALALGLNPMAFTTVAQAQGNPEVSQRATININTADAQALEAGIKGVGKSRAADIVRYRETYGPFKSIDELTEVKGVGKSTVENNREILSL